MTAELRVFSYVSTVKNKQLNEIGAFKDEKILEVEINKELGAFQSLPDETKKQKVAEFQRYLEFKSSSKDLMPATHIWRLNESEIENHFATLLRNNQNQYAKKQALKNQQQSDIMVGSEVSLVKNAMKFYNTFVAGASESDLEKAAALVNPKWSKKAMWMYIFGRLGMVYQSKNMAKSKKDKAINQTTLKAFFDDEVIFERQIWLWGAIN